MYYAITAHPLLNEHQDQLNEYFKTNIQYLTLHELKKLSIWKIFLYIRKLNVTKFIIPLKANENSDLLPLLSCIAILSKAKNIEIIYSNLLKKDIKKIHLIYFLSSFIFASIQGYFSIFKCNFQIKNLKKSNLKKFTNLNSGLYINGNLWYDVKAGGSVGHIAGVTNTLSQFGIKMHYVAISENTLLDSKIIKHPITPLKQFSIPWELNYYRFNLSLIKQLLKIFRKESLDFIYQRLSISNYVGLILARKLRVPLIIEYNGSEIWVEKNWGRTLRFPKLAKHIENTVLKQADMVVTISQILYEELINQGVKPEKILFYPNCVDPKFFNPARFDANDCLKLRERYGISSDALVITFVGTFGIWHGITVLANSIKWLVENSASWLQNHKIHFLLVGDGALSSEIKKMLAIEPYNSFITFTGLIPQNETPLHLAISDVFLSPHIPNSDGSRFFGSPTKIFEYMAMGKPIIASRLEQIEKIFENSLCAEKLSQSSFTAKNNESGILCEPNNSSEIVKAIIFLVEHPEWRKLLGDNARENVLTKYTWEHHVTKILNKFTLLSGLEPQ